MRSVTTVLTAATLLVAGGAGGAALSARPDRAAAPSRAASPAPVEVRTQVIHRTVHVVRHVKPKSAAAAPPAPVVAVAPARAQPTAATPARPAARPLRTRSSTTGGEREDRRQRDGGDEGEGRDD
jgi:hypothetical protein